MKINFRVAGLARSIVRLFKRHVFMACIIVLACSDEVTNTWGTVAFQFNSPGNAMSAVKSESPDFVHIVIEKDDGVVTEEYIDVIGLGGGYATTPLLLMAGSYTLERFVVFDSDSNELYEAPVAGTPTGELVDDPLPQEFRIEEGGTIALSPSLVGVRKADDFEFLISGTFYDVHYYDDKINFELEVIAKDAPLGSVTWSRKFAINGRNMIHIPKGYGHYTFRALRTNFIPHTQHYLTGDLKKIGHLEFEFISTTLRYTIRKVEPATGITMYFPDDIRRCFLFSRIDIPEGYIIEEIGYDRVARTKNFVTLPPIFNFYCERSGEDEIAQCLNPVNIFDNKPFSLSEMFCARIDLSMSDEPITLDDVNITSHVWLLVRKVGEAEHRYIDFFHEWRGINN